MKVRVVYFEGCPNLEPAVSLIREVAEGVSIPVEIHKIRVETPEEATHERMLGSPTIQIDGLDIDPSARDRSDFAFSCRVFDGQRGLPSRKMVAAALTGREYSSGGGNDAPHDGGCCG